MPWSSSFRFLDELKRSQAESSEAQIHHIKKSKTEEPKRFKKRAKEDQYMFNSVLKWGSTVDSLRTIWVKHVNCFYCGKPGHWRAQCTTFLAKTSSSIWLEWTRKLWSRCSEFLFLWKYFLQQKTGKVLSLPEMGFLSWTYDLRKRHRPSSWKGCTSLHNARSWKQHEGPNLPLACFLLPSIWPCFLSRS